MSSRRGSRASARSKRHTLEDASDSDVGSDSALSIGSILASSDDSCERLGMPEELDKKKRRRDKNAPKELDQIDKPISQQPNWKFYKKLLRGKYKKARGAQQ